MPQPATRPVRRVDRPDDRSPRVSVPRRARHRARRHPRRPGRSCRLAPPAPRPDRGPDRPRAAQLDPGLVLAPPLRHLGWLAWAYFVLCVASTVVAHLRGRQHTWHPRLGQAAAAGLVTAVMVLGQLRGTPAGRTSAPVPVVQLAADTTAAAVVQPAAVTHTVVAGDTLWGIATTYYGNGAEWQAIYQANVGVPQPGGGALGDAHWIYPGWVLVIPDVDAPPVAAAPCATVERPAPAPVTPITASGGHDISARPLPSARRAAPAKVGAHPAAVHRLRPAARILPTTPRPAAAQRRSCTTTRGRTPAPWDRTLAAGPTAPRRSRTTTRSAPLLSVPGSSDWPPSASSPPSTGAAGGRADAVPPARVSPYRPRTARWPTSSSGSATTPGPTACSGSPAFPTFSPTALARHGRRSPQCVSSTAGSRSSSPPRPVIPAPPSRHGPVSRPSGTCRMTRIRAVLDDTALDEPVPLTLVTVGHGDGGTLLVNLDHYGSVHIQVEADQVPGTLAAIGTELAGTTAPEAVTVVAVGVGHGVIDRLGNGIVTDDLEATLGRLQPGQEAIVLVDAHHSPASSPSSLPVRRVSAW
jgi:hypothetical protein